MKKLKLLASGLLAIVGTGYFLCAQPIYAANAQSICQGSGGNWNANATGNKCTTPNDTRTVQSTILQLVNLLLFIVGVTAVIMIVLGALRYAGSNGDQAAINSAKTIILYAIVGLIVSIGAFAVVHFVLISFGIEDAQPTTSATP